MQRDAATAAWLGGQVSNLDSQIQSLVSYRLDDPQTRWLGDQGSNLDSQIQNLMSYLLDDPQNKNPGRSMPAGDSIQKADRGLPSLCEGGLRGLLLAPVHVLPFNIRGYGCV